MLEEEFKYDLALGKEASSSHDRGKATVQLMPSMVYLTLTGQHPTITTASITIDLGAETEVNRILIQEYIKLGQRIKSFSVEAYIQNEWKHILDGTTVGYKVIRKFPLVKASLIRVTFNDSKACPVISNIQIFRAPGN